MSTSSSGRNAWRQAVAAFWVAETMLLVVFVFFALVGGVLFDSPVFALVVLVGAVLLAIHLLNRHRNRNRINASPAVQHERERRGF